MTKKSNEKIGKQVTAARSALLVSDDSELGEALQDELAEKYHLVITESVPHIWGDDIDLIFVVFDGDAKATIEQIINLELVSKGRPIFVLLKQKDADFVISASHYGARGFILVPDELSRVLPIIHMQFRRTTGRSGQLSVFFSLKGGVGQTTLAVNIADEIARFTQGQVVLVDLGLPLGDVPLFFDFEPENYYSLNDFAYNLNRFDEELLLASLMRTPSGLYVLPLPQDPAEIEQINADRIKGVIHLLRKYFDHVLVDCAHDFSATSLTVLDEADNLVLVSEPTLPALRATYQAQQVFKKLGYDIERLKLILNRFEENERVNKVVEQLEIPCVVRVDNDYHGFNEALTQGKAYVDHVPNGKITQQLDWIAHMLHYGPPDNESEVDVLHQTHKGNRWIKLFKHLLPFFAQDGQREKVTLRRRTKMKTV